MITTRYGVECLYINKQNNSTFKSWLNESGFCDQDNAKLFIKKIMQLDLVVVWLKNFLL